MTAMQIDLTEDSGLPISLDLETGKLSAIGEVDLGEQGERRLTQLREVLADPDAATDDRICYRTYRGVGTNADRELLDRHGLRYDITVTLPGLIGREFTKTAGHHHLPGPDDAVYPEVYEVVHGRAAFVMQTVGLIGVTSGWIQICEPHERIMIPPKAGHVTVNIGNVPLVVCDLIATECTNNYDLYRSVQGAAYYIVLSPGGFAVEPNTRYPNAGKLSPEVGYGSRWPQDLPSDAPLIDLFRLDPNVFRFLTETKSFEDED
jgi:glucose-6-phosphate isomerase